MVSKQIFWKAAIGWIFGIASSRNTAGGASSAATRAARTIRSKSITSSHGRRIRICRSESNLQVLCRQCNLGKSNKDSTDWRHAPTRELTILQTCDPAKRAKLQQLGYLRISSDIDKSMKREADRQYRKLWREIEEEWFARGKPE